MTDLHTPRLELRPLRRQDHADLHAHWTEPAVRRYLWDGRIIAPDETREVIRTSDALFAQRGAGLWSIRSDDADALIGAAGYWYFHEPPELELLISLSASHWGRGLAREAAAALIDYAFDALDWPWVQASADAPNEASLRLLRRLGMQPAGDRPGEFGRIEVFRLLSAQRAWIGVKPARPSRP